MVLLESPRKSRKQLYEASINQKERSYQKSKRLTEEIPKDKVLVILKIYQGLEFASLPLHKERCRSFEVLPKPLCHLHSLHPNLNILHPLHLHCYSHIFSSILSSPKEASVRLDTCLSETVAKPTKL